MNHLDLFSGIGGFALAAKWVWGDEHYINAFVEIDPFCRKVLKKHWTDVPIHNDIRKYKYDGTAIDLITGGFPCQPFSAAGKRKGTEDDRHLWPEMLRVIREVHPRWVIAENVAGLISIDKGLVLEQVFTDLESAGYQVQPFVIPACAVNAPHRRDRVWIVGYSKGDGNTKFSKGYREEDSTRKMRPIIINKSDSHAPDAFHKGYIWGGCKGNTNESGVEKGEQTGDKSWGATARCNENGWQENWYEIATRLCRMDDGVPDRVDRLKSLGNAIVPQVVVPIMQAIKEMETL